MTLILIFMCCDTLCVISYLISFKIFNMTRSGLVRDNKPIKKRQYKKKETKNNESNQEHEPSLYLVLDDSVTESTQSERSIAEDNASDDEVADDEDREVEEEEVDEDGCESCKDEDESEIEIETQKKTRKRAYYIPVGHFSTHESLDTYIRSTNKFPMKITHNEPFACSFCKDKSHKMIQIYLKCNCGENNEQCDLKYCVRACLNNCSDWLQSLLSI